MLITKKEKLNMVSKIFLDANFLLDIVLQRPGFAYARRVMQAAIDREIEAYTSPSVLHIVAYFLTKAHNAPTAKKIIGTLLNDVTVIDCTHATAVLALHSNISDFEDALQYYTALAHNTDFFISGDTKLKKIALPQLPVCTAKELLPQAGLEF